MTTRITSHGGKAGLLLLVAGVPVLLVMMFMPWIGVIALALLIPVILLALFSGALSAKRDRLRTGHCKSCEYPLLGLEDVDRCPECGEGILGEAR